MADKVVRHFVSRVQGIQGYTIYGICTTDPPQSAEQNVTADLHRQPFFFFPSSLEQAHLQIIVGC